jgi:hypothetical protein
MNVAAPRSIRRMALPALMACIVTSVSATQVSAAVKAGAEVPVSLLAAEEYGENVYDYTKAKDWKQAHTAVQSLARAAKTMREEIPDQSATEDRLDAVIVTLREAVTARDRQRAMHDANQATWHVLQMTAAYEAPTPIEVGKLDYYGRELEVWSQVNDLGKLQTTTTAMRREWNALKARVSARSPGEAAKFGGLVKQLEAAAIAADYARLATAILDEVDNVEKVFDPKTAALCPGGCLLRLIGVAGRASAASTACAPPVLQHRDDRSARAQRVQG